MGMTESKKAQAVGALRKCAKEHEKDITFTFNIRVSDLCNDIADYVEELQKENTELKDLLEKKIGEKTNLEIQIKKMRCCGNCKEFWNCIEKYKITGNSKCDKWECI